MRPSPASRSSSARTRRNRRKRDWFRLLLAILVLALVGELVYLSLTSPRLRITRIDIRGAQTIPVADLRDRASFVLGKNIILADAHAVRRSVLKNPVVLQARVYRRPMNRLIVRIEERKPFIILALDGASYLTDEKGLAYAKAEGHPKGIPTVYLSATHPVHIPCRPYESQVSSAFDSLRVGRKNNFKIAKISVDRDSNMCLNMESGFWVKLGPPLELEKKFSSLKDVLAHKPEIATQALYVDMRCVTAPAWKPKGDSPTPQ